MLNNRQSYIRLAVVMMNGLMGMMVVIAYLTIDKSSGLIRAMALNAHAHAQLSVEQGVRGADNVADLLAGDYHSNHGRAAELSAVYPRRRAGFGALVHDRAVDGELL